MDLSTVRRGPPKLSLKQTAAAAVVPLALAALLRWRRTSGTNAGTCLFFLELVVVLALLGAACGGDGGSEVSPGPTSEASVTPSLTPFASPVAASGKIAFIDLEGNLALISPDGSGQEVLTEGGGVKGFRWSPDGSLIALEGGEGAGFGLRVSGVDGEVLFELEDGSSPVWSPQGDRLAVSQGSTIAVYDKAGAKVREIADAQGAAWSPNERTLAFLRPEGDGGSGVPLLADVATGSESPLSEEIEPHDLVYSIAWHPDGSAIAYRDGIYEVASGQKADLPGVPVRWSPDGRLLMVTLETDPESNSTPAHLLDLAQGKAVIGLDVRPSADGTPPWLYVQRWTDFSPNSRFLIYLDPLPYRLRARIYDTIALRQYKYPDIRGQAPSASPDNAHVVFMDAGKVWVMVLDGSALKDIAQGSQPSWQPSGQPAGVP